MPIEKRDIALLAVDKNTLKGIGPLLPIPMLDHIEKGSLATLVSGKNETVSSGYPICIGDTLILLGVEVIHGDSGSPSLIEIDGKYYSLGTFARGWVRGMLMTREVARDMSRVIQNTLDNRQGGKEDFMTVTSDQDALMAVKGFCDRKASSSPVEKKLALIGWGSTLVDAFHRQGSDQPVKALGGSVCNTIANFGRIAGKDVRALLISALGCGADGDFLMEECRRLKMDLSGLVRIPGSTTSRLNIHLQSEGGSYRTELARPGTYGMLSAEHIASFEKSFAAARFVIFGLSAMIPGTAIEKATNKALEYVANYGNIVYFDANMRLGTWEKILGSGLKARKKTFEAIGRGMRHADIIKMTEHELLFFSQRGNEFPEHLKTEARLSNAIWTISHTQKKWSIIIITHGRKGCRYVIRSRLEDLPFTGPGSVDAVQAQTEVSVLGAGDAFNASVVYGLYTILEEQGKALQDITEDELIMILRFASRVSARVVAQEACILEEDIDFSLRDETSSRSGSSSITTETLLERVRRALEEQERIMASVRPALGVQIAGRKTVKVADMPKGSFDVTKGESLDDSRRIQVTGDAACLDDVYHASIPSLIEVPAQRCVREIIEADGYTIWSNAWGPAVLGVEWVSNEIHLKGRNFTALVYEDYEEVLHREAQADSPFMNEDGLTEELAMRIKPRFNSAADFFSYYEEWRRLNQDSKLLVITRHGESASNLFKYQQTYDTYSPLTLRGLRQAGEMAGFFTRAGVRFDRYIASDLERAFCTLLPSARAAGRELQVLRRLRETLIVPFYQELGRFIDNPERFTCGEYSGEKTKRYLRRFLNDLITGEDQSAIVASHGMTILLIIMEALNISYEQYSSVYKALDNSPLLGVTVLAYKPGIARWQLLVYGDNSYLSEQAQGKTRDSKDIIIDQVRFVLLAFFRLMLKHSGFAKRRQRDYYPSGRDMLYLLRGGRAFSPISLKGERDKLNRYYESGKLEEAKKWAGVHLEYIDRAGLDKNDRLVADSVRHARALIRMVDMRLKAEARCEDRFVLSDGLESPGSRLSAVRFFERTKNGKFIFLPSVSGVTELSIARPDELKPMPEIALVDNRQFDKVVWAGGRNLALVEVNPNEEVAIVSGFHCECYAVDIWAQRQGKTVIGHAHIEPDIHRFASAVKPKLRLKGKAGKGFQIYQSVLAYLTDQANGLEDISIAFGPGAGLVDLPPVPEIRRITEDFGISFRAAPLDLKDHNVYSLNTKGYSLMREERFRARRISDYRFHVRTWDASSSVRSSPSSVASIDKGRDLLLRELRRMKLMFTAYQEILSLYGRETRLFVEYALRELEADRADTALIASATEAVKLMPDPQDIDIEKGKENNWFNWFKKIDLNALSLSIGEGCAWNCQHCICGNHLSLAQNDPLPVVLQKIALYKAMFNGWGSNDILNWRDPFFGVYADAILKYVTNLTPPKRLFIVSRGPEIDDQGAQEAMRNIGSLELNIVDRSKGARFWCSKAGDLFIVSFHLCSSRYDIIEAIYEKAALGKNELLEAVIENYINHYVGTVGSLCHILSGLFVQMTINPSYYNQLTIDVLRAALGRIGLSRDDIKQVTLRAEGFAKGLPYRRHFATDATKAGDFYATFATMSPAGRGEEFMRRVELAENKDPSCLRQAEKAEKPGERSDPEETSYPAVMISNTGRVTVQSIVDGRILVDSTLDELDPVGSSSPTAPSKRDALFAKAETVPDSDRSASSSLSFDSAIEQFVKGKARLPEDIAALKDLAFFRKEDHFGGFRIAEDTLLPEVHLIRETGDHFRQERSTGQRFLELDEESFAEMREKLQKALYAIFLSSVLEKLLFGKEWKAKPEYFELFINSAFDNPFNMYLDGTLNRYILEESPFAKGNLYEYIYGEGAGYVGYGVDNSYEGLDWDTVVKDLLIPAIAIREDFVVDLAVLPKDPYSPDIWLVNKVLACPSEQTSLREELEKARAELQKDGSIKYCYGSIEQSYNETPPCYYGHGYPPIPLRYMGNALLDRIEQVLEAIFVRRTFFVREDLIGDSNRSGSPVGEFWRQGATAAASSPAGGQGKEREQQIREFSRTGLIEQGEFSFKLFKTPVGNAATHYEILAYEGTEYTYCAISFTVESGKALMDYADPQKGVFNHLLSVEVEYRHHGLGSALVGLASDIVYYLYGINEFYIYNAPPCHAEFYEGLGFEQIGGVKKLELYDLKKTIGKEPSIPEIIERFQMEIQIKKEQLHLKPALAQRIAFLKKIAGNAEARGPVVYYPGGGFDIFTPFTMVDDATDVISVGLESFGVLQGIAEFLHQHFAGLIPDSFVYKFNKFDYEGDICTAKAEELGISGFAGLAILRIIVLLGATVTGIRYFNIEDVPASGEPLYLNIGQIKKNTSAVIDFTDSEGTPKRFWYLYSNLDKESAGFQNFINRKGFQTWLSKAYAWSDDLYACGIGSSFEIIESIKSNILRPAKANNAVIITDVAALDDEAVAIDKQVLIWKKNKGFPKVYRLERGEEFGYSTGAKYRECIYYGEGRYLADFAREEPAARVPRPPAASPEPGRQKLH
ncbi:PfkB family carbohydrate kinase, partial [Candidatus Omnitrophota bacterium]